MKNNNDQVIYQLSVADVQTVSRRVLRRRLNGKEVALVGEAVGDYIDWNQAIFNAIQAHVSARPVPRVKK